MTGYVPALHAFTVSHLTIYSVLIPPIILHAAYDLYHPAFLAQLPSVLTLAVLGTALAAAVIALGLHFIYARLINPAMNIYQILTFSSIIAAVDPVAVLAVFEQVEEHLHISTPPHLTPPHPRWRPTVASTSFSSGRRSSTMASPSSSLRGSRS